MFSEYSVEKENQCNTNVEPCNTSTWTQSFSKWWGNETYQHMQRLHLDHSSYNKIINI